jgi:hypothetical protein
LLLLLYLLLKLALVLRLCSWLEALLLLLLLLPLLVLNLALTLWLCSWLEALLLLLLLSLLMLNLTCCLTRLYLCSPCTTTCRLPTCCWCRPSTSHTRIPTQRSIACPVGQVLFLESPQIIGSQGRAATDRSTCCLLSCGALPCRWSRYCRST